MKFCLAVLVAIVVAVEAVEFGKPGKCPSPLAMFCLPGKSAPDTCQSDLYCQGSDKCCYACGSRSCHTTANFKGQYLSLEELFKTVSTPKPKEHACSCRSTWADFCMPGHHAQDTCKSDSDCHLSEKCCTVCGIRGCDRPVNNHLPTPSPTPIPGQVSKTGSNFENLMKMLLNC